MTKLLYVKFVCVSVCEVMVCEYRREEAGGGGARDTESKTRTPHKVVGKNNNTIENRITNKNNPTGRITKKNKKEANKQNTIFCPVGLSSVPHCPGVF